VFSQEMDGRFAQRIRVAENVPGTTRVVIDLLDRVDVTTSLLANPYRLMIELRAAASASPSTTRENPPPPVPVQPASKPAAQSKAAEPPVTRPEPAVQTVQAAASAPPLATTSKTPPPSKTTVEQPVIPDVVPVVQTISAPAEPAAPKPAPKQASAPATRKPPSSASTAKQVEIAAAAKRTSDGEASLTRVLGLKIGRVVIDPGHGGHDQGTSGPKGLLEKDLVLDVALRLGKLIEERLGSQVIYTRTDDTFVPLHERTAMANDNRADLFLSVHANNSANPKIAGVETFYLNVTGSRDAMDVAARENASSDKSVFELADMIQKIAKADKAEESREFAGRIQASLSSFSSKYVANSHDRGVKTAPFVVLIGARMPSVLAEIGFLSNPREEALFKKPEHRQRIAEA
jgi:N-acetylmuramoyl-L-alanine amidase